MPTPFMLEKKKKKKKKRREKKKKKNTLCDYGKRVVNKHKFLLYYNHS